MNNSQSPEKEFEMEEHELLGEKSPVRPKEIVVDPSKVKDLYDLQNYVKAKISE